MSALLEIDKYQRQIISILFRILMSIYSIFLLYSATKLFAWYFNIGAFLIYLAIYIILLINKNIWFSRLRLLNDFIFITYVIYQYNVIDVFSMALIFAPILNCHNHSGDKKSFLLYIYPIACIYIINQRIDILIILPFLFFLLINLFDSFRTKYFRFQQKLNTVIDNFFIKDGFSKRPYVIYKSILPIINDSKILVNPITNIFCVKIESKDKIIFVNGSEFVWNFKINDKNGFLKQLKTNKILFNIEIEKDEKIVTKNLISVCPINSHYYCFFMISERNENFNVFPYNYFINKLISPFFYRLANIIDADLNQKKFELSKLYELEAKISYVSNSANAMHYIKNKLGPLKSYLAMYDDYEKTTDKEKKERIKPYLPKERQKLKSALDQILERADYILKKSNNPFNVIHTDFYGIQKLYSEIRRVWSYYFDIENFEVKWNVNESEERFDVKYNTIGLELVLSNWLSNMNRCNSGIFGIQFDECIDSYIVIFFNSFDNTKPNSSKFVEEFMSSDRIEISRRESHGLLEVKDFLEQMKIQGDLYIRDNIVYFSLTFNKHKHNEDTNN